MAGNVSHKLKNPIEGALAGGGDPATSPLYVFSPFLPLLALVAGGLFVSFGSAIWMVIITITVVSVMYRLVMRWITDGSGGSGLCEEEFGPWAVKLNAAITFVEYTLTFLVSMSSMVTFIADRIPMLNNVLFNLGPRHFLVREIVAILLAVLVGWLVNRGPRVAASAFGPATAAIIILLWLMIFATILNPEYGFRLPVFSFKAFSPEFLSTTIRGYTSILAVMTGIEVFANLVAAYEGSSKKRSRNAFISLLIIMSTTGATMLIVGPAIRDIYVDFLSANPDFIPGVTKLEQSVFTMTMDTLLPAWISYIGSFVSILVLMSASAAASQGIQNLALGLTNRKYIPAKLGEINENEVANRPVWIQVTIVAIFFALVGTQEETYLAIYAAGVFILLSMTGWAVTKRLLNMLKSEKKFGTIATLAGTIFAALLTTFATAMIFYERFAEGAWMYLIFVPILFMIFTYYRNNADKEKTA